MSIEEVMKNILTLHIEQKRIEQNLYCHGYKIKKTHFGISPLAACRLTFRFFTIT